MTGWKVINYNLINDVDQDKVQALAQSIHKNGWIGCPILVNGDELLTGSHRVAALRMIAEEYDDISILDQEVAEDVSQLVEAAFQKFEHENGYLPDLDYSDIGWIFQGTWVERYKSEIEEW